LAKSYIKNSNINFLGNLIKPQKFNDTIRGLTIYSDRKDEYGNLYNLYLKKIIDKKNFQITFAKKGVFKEVNKISILVLYDGETINGKNNKITNFKFSKSDFSLQNLKTNTVTYTKLQEISTFNLIKCFYEIYFLKRYSSNQSIDRCNEKNLKVFFIELYKRLAIPFYIPLLSLIPFLLLVSSKENTNYTKIKYLTFIIGFFIIIFSETSIRLISDILERNFIILVFPFVLILSLYFFFIKKFRLKNFRF